VVISGAGKPSSGDFPCSPVTKQRLNKVRVSCN
jgi:hypothetical protein